MLVPVLLRITHWTKSELLVSPDCSFLTNRAGCVWLLREHFYSIWVYRLTFVNCPVIISSPFIYLFFTFIFLGHGRSKRSHNITNFSACSQESITTTTGCLSKKNAIQINSQRHVRYNLNCTYRTHACLYIVNCYPTGQGIYKCDKISHFEDYLDFCCDLVCWQ